MKKQYLIAASFLFCSPLMCLAQVTAGQDYFITSNAASLNVAPISPANGSDVRQVTVTDDTAKWQFVPVSGGAYYIKLKNNDLYLATPEKQNKISGVKVELSSAANANSTWTIETNSGSYRLKNKQNNFYLGNGGNNASAALLKQIQTPGPGSNWKLQSTAAAAATPAGNLSSTSTGPALKNYDTQWLRESRTVGQANSISQNVSVDYGYDVKLAFGQPSTDQGVNSKFIVLETHGSLGFNPGQVAESGNTNDKAKFRGYYIESITTQARVVSGSASLFKCLPENTSTAGSSSISQGFQISLSGGAGADGGAVGGANLSIGYSMEKSSSISYTDFSIGANSETSKCTHTYKLTLVKTIGGGSKAYADYKDMKNANNLGIKPLQILPDKATTSFPLYEFIAFEAAANATGTVTIEVKADFVVNYVKWTGTQIVQSPETVTATKQFTVNLADVGPSQ